MEKMHKSRYQICVSEKAYFELNERAKCAEYKGRGVVGVVDKALFGEFTAKGAGRPMGAKSKNKKTVDK